MRIKLELKGFVAALASDDNRMYVRSRQATDSLIAGVSVHHSGLFVSQQPPRFEDIRRSLSPPRSIEFDEISLASVRSPKQPMDKYVQLEHVVSGVDFECQAEVLPDPKESKVM